MEIASQRYGNGRWIVGGALMIIGVLLLLMNIGTIERFHIWKFTPLILVVLGIHKMMQPYHRAEGFWLFGLGVWLEVSLLRVFDVGFYYTWPAVLILLGIFWMWQSIERDARRKNAEAQLHSTTSISEDTHGN